VFFELIVARTLQILGGQIEVEIPVKETNRRPDFYVRFGDETTTVEATVPELNRATGEQMEWNEELVEIIESFTPPVWTVLVWRLPKLGPNDSKREFKRAIARAFQAILLTLRRIRHPLRLADSMMSCTLHCYLVGVESEPRLREVWWPVPTIPNREYAPL
jgi:hypothetical protein